MFKLYLEAKLSESNEIYTTLESLITLFTYEFLKKPDQIELQQIRVQLLEQHFQPKLVVHNQ